jgi:glutaminyl-tRNA synthetase
MNFIEEIIEKDKDKKLKFRFPPEPNADGLHIGHAKSIILNFGLAEKYNVNCNLRFDDTNPLKEDLSFVKGMINDVEWLLGYELKNNIKFASYYFDFIYECAKILIKKKLAYVDDSSSKEIADMKGTPTIPGVDSPYKSRTVEENLDLIERMKKGEFKEGSKILRANIDMSSPNMILRDPILYRIIDIEHPNIGDSWKIYPTYDMAHPISDYIEGISHSLCTLEFEVHRPLYEWVLNNCNLEEYSHPIQIEFNRLNIDHTILSKRKLKTLVDENIVDGWDDPRMPTISGMRRRGYTPTAIKDFCERVGYSKKESLIDYSLLEACLREELNKTANRYMGVSDPIKLTITNWEDISNNNRKFRDTKFLDIENNPEDENSGVRIVPFTKNLWIEREDFREEANRKYHRLKLGGEVRLKGAYVVKAYDCTKDEKGDIVEVFCTVDPNSESGKTLDRKIKGTIHWVSREDAIECEFIEYDRLFAVERPDKEEDFVKWVNPAVVKKGYVELNCDPNINDMSKPFQFMRKGYYILDPDSTSDKLIFNRSVTLRERNF